MTRPRRPILLLASGLLALGATAVGCGERTTPAASPAATTAPLPSSYTYELTSSCGERALLGTYLVTVVDEAVDSVAVLDAAGSYRPGPQDVPTLADLLAQGRDPDAEGTVDLVVDDAGLPVSLSLDPIPNGIDDEECYEVADIRPYDGPPGTPSSPSSSPSADPPAPSDPVATPRAVRDDPAYQRWLARDPLPSCGAAERLTPGDDSAPRSSACLRAARAAGDGAEALLTYDTVEGDPIRSYVRVLPGGAVEVFTDSSEDAFGSLGWRYRRCADLDGALRLRC